MKGHKKILLNFHYLMKIIGILVLLIWFAAQGPHSRTMGLLTQLLFFKLQEEFVIWKLPLNSYYEEHKNYLQGKFQLMKSWARWLLIYLADQGPHAVGLVARFELKEREVLSQGNITYSYPGHVCVRQNGEILNMTYTFKLPTICWKISFLNGLSKIVIRK